MKKGRLFLFIAILIYFSFGLLCLFPAEIILKNGDIYLAEILEEQEDFIKIKWRFSTYNIPRSEILSIDKSQSGKDQIYNSSEIILKDGSKLLGVISEENQESVTAKTSLGFIQLDRNKIAKINSRANQEPTLSQFQVIEPNKKFTNIGISGFYQGFYKLNPDSSLNNAAGGNFFIEPQALVLNRFFRIGFLGEYQSTPKINGEELSLYNGIIYINSDLRFSTWLHFYSNIGGGSSYMRYAKEDTTTAGVNGIGQFSLGYQGFSFNRVLIRIGYKASYVFEKHQGLLLQGGEFSVGYML